MMDYEQAKEKRLQLFDNLCNSDLVTNFPKTDPLLNVDTDQIIPSNFDDFYDQYASMFRTSLSVLHPLEERLQECDSIVNKYANLFFRQDGDTFTPIKPVPRSFSVSLDEMEKFESNNELSLILKQRKQIMSNLLTATEKERKTVENLRYKPFQINVYNDWASDTTIEVIDILDKVTHAQKYKESFLSYWNKIIRGETSQHLLTDIFWWFYLTYFIKPDNVDEECENYLSRIAKNYVELLLSIDPWFRDKFFNIYASYLAQAVYQTFFDTCPDSRLSFTDAFKEFVATTIAEWISGAQATGESYKNWKIRADSTMLSSDNALKEKSSANDIYKKILRLEEELEALGGDTGDETTRSAAVRTPKKNSSLNMKHLPEVEDELFRLSTRSTLVARFLDQCDIQPCTPRLRNVHRTHVKGWPTGQ